MIKKRQIYAGDYVRMKEEYIRQWDSEDPERLKSLRETIFIVVESCRCYNWKFGIGGGGMLLTLRPYLGPLLGQDIEISRGEESLELIDPAEVDVMIARCIEEDIDSITSHGELRRDNS